MLDFRSYMSSVFIEDTSIITELEKQIKGVTSTFYKSFDREDKPWPYELRPSQKHPDGVRSQTTTSMILSAIIGTRGEWGKMPWKRAASGMVYFSDFPFPESTSDAVKSIPPGPTLFKTVDSLIQTWIVSTSHITSSDTFGNDDPMSLGWSLDLVRWALYHNLGNKDDQEALLKKIVQVCVVRSEQITGSAVRKHARDSAHPSLCESLLSFSSIDRKAGDSSYILARFSTVLRSLADDNSPLKLSPSDREKVERCKEVLFERFETRLHDHLSFSEIVDSRFDPTELAFCLEGMLLIRPGHVGRTVFERVMQVLRRAQDKGAPWRSVTPMLYRHNGDVLFPVSVEAANAVLASFALFDGRWSQYDSVASTSIDLVKRYWTWLKARKAIVQIQNHHLEGWHSEHVNDPNLVHLWETSQITEFLINFRDQLRRDVARTSLKLSACSYTLPDRPKAIETELRDDATPEERWDAARKFLEPVTCLGERFEVYRSIGTHFVKPRFKENGKQAYSMLLYGPPGTGKTTIASSLSWALDYPLITVTVSDFLADGPAIEARAKDLFRMLQAQPRTIVLFDEIDQFMLDRDSEYFRDQDTVFQFLTPGLLTKLNDLRASRSVLFIIATNYAERIDSAIKRQGRIDQHLLLLPPDRERRKKLVEKFWSSGGIDVDAAAAKSVFLSHNDMEFIRKTYVDTDVIEEIAATLPSATPDTYIVRFRRRNDDPISDVRRVPMFEFIAMVALEVDAAGKVEGASDWKKKIKYKALNRFEKSHSKMILPALEDEIARIDKARRTCAP